MVLMVANGSLACRQDLALLQAWLVGQRWTPPERVMRLLLLNPVMMIVVLRLSATL